MPVGVPLAKFAVTTMDEQFGTLVFGDLARGLDSFGLGIEERRITVGILFAYSPVRTPLYHVLVWHTFLFIVFEP